MSSKAPWIICPLCSGDGSTSAHMGIVDREDWDEEDFQAYLDGKYDQPCSVCKGSGKVREDYKETDGPIIRRSGLNGEQHIYRDADDASEHWLRMAGG